MTYHPVTCPHCGSDSVHPAFYTPWAMGCLRCGEEFDLRGGFWARLWDWLTGKRVGGFWS